MKVAHLGIAALAFSLSACLTPAYAVLPKPPVQSTNAGQYAYKVALFTNSTATGTSAEVWTANWGHPLLAISVESGTCTDLSVVAEGSLDGTHWAPIPILNGNATITEADVPVSSTRIFQVPAGLLYFRARRETVSSCTVTAVLGLAP